MSRARLVITAITQQGLSQAEAARTYGLSEATVSRLMARYRAEGEAAFEPRSKRPKASPTALSAQLVDLIVRLRKELTETGLDAGPETIGWHLAHHHGHQISRATIARYLGRAGLVVPEPKKRPKSSYTRFEASMPNQTWQSDFTHYRLTGRDGRPGRDVEIISWLDDCTRYALHVSAHVRVSAPIVLATFRETTAQHGIPGSTLTDNGMVYTVRWAGGRGGRNGFEHQLQLWGVVQKNSRPGHPTTCGKVERFQQTLKNWLTAQPDQPSTIDQLQGLIDRFREQYNHHRPHRSLPHRATPATVYNTMPKAVPGPSTDADTHDRIRHDIVDKSGTVTLRVAGKLRHIGIGRTHTRTHVILLVQDLQVRVINAITGELLRKLTIDLNRDYQPRK
ncbi:MAG TPA: IS481 family transposase [Jiangellaceae bacterium]|nr:IS481 family transposase [Jiangellaceae bacterium]